MNRHTLTPFACVVLALACANDATLAPIPGDGVLSMHGAAGPVVVEGQTGQGSLYSLHLPAAWNGDLVLYAHGYRFDNTPVALPVIDDLRDGLLAMGYGVAYSSYSENGYAIEDGVRRTRQLRGLFASNFGPPRNTYVMGHSLGGIITLKAAEQNPGLFAGALPYCSLVGGSRLETDYLFHGRMLFDYFYPGIIPGSPISPPDDLDFNTLIPVVAGAVLANPAGAVEMAAVHQLSIVYNDIGELLNSIIILLYFQVEGGPDVIDRMHGHNGFDNTGTVYAGSSDDAALNAGVARFAATPDALQFLNRAYQPDGKLGLPVLTLHTTRDPLVPAWHEPAYAAIAAAAGSSNLLVQRTVDRFGHCAFTTAEQLDAFTDLVTWVETGVAPSP